MLYGRNHANLAGYSRKVIWPGVVNRWSLVRRVWNICLVKFSQSNSVARIILHRTAIHVFVYNTGIRNASEERIVLCYHIFICWLLHARCIPIQTLIIIFTLLFLRLFKTDNRRILSIQGTSPKQLESHDHHLLKCLMIKHST